MPQNYSHPPNPKALMPLEMPEPDTGDTQPLPVAPVPSPSVEATPARIGDRVIINRGSYQRCVATIIGIDDDTWHHVEIPYWQQGERGLVTATDTFRSDEIDPPLPIPYVNPHLVIGDIVKTMGGIQDAIGQSHTVAGVTVYKVNGHHQWYPVEDLQLISPFQAVTTDTDTDTDAARVIRLERQLEELTRQLTGGSLGSFSELKSAQDRARYAEHVAAQLQLDLHQETAKFTASEIARKGLRQQIATSRRDIQFLEAQLVDAEARLATEGLSSTVEVKTVIYEIALVQRENNPRAVDTVIAEMINSGWKVAHEHVSVEGQTLAYRIIRYQRALRPDSTAFTTAASAAATMEAIVEGAFETPEYTDADEAELVLVNEADLDFDTLTYEQGIQLLLDDVITADDLKQIGNRQALDKALAAARRAMLRPSSRSFSPRPLLPTVVSTTVPPSV